MQTTQERRESQDGQGARVRPKRNMTNLPNPWDGEFLRPKPNAKPKGKTKQDRRKGIINETDPFRKL